MYSFTSNAIKPVCVHTCVFSLSLIDESPRWLLVTGRKDEALRVMARASRLNQVALPPEEDLMGLLEKVRRRCAGVRFEEESTV